MHRTTLNLEDGLVEKLRQRAVKQGRSLAAVINELLHKALVSEERQKKLPSIQWKVFHCGRPKVDITDRDALYEAMEEQ